MSTEKHDMQNVWLRVKYEISRTKLRTLTPGSLGELIILIPNSSPCSFVNSTKWGSICTAWDRQLEADLTLNSSNLEEDLTLNISNLEADLTLNSSNLKSLHNLILIWRT